MRKSKICKYIDKIHIRYFINMLPILIIPIFIMIMIYYRSNEIILEQTYETNLAVLKSSAETVQKIFGDMDKLFVYIGESPSIHRFLEFINPLNDGSTTTELMRLQMDLKALTIANDLLQNLQVYSVKNRVMIDSSTTALHINRYYLNNFEIKGMTLDDWYNNILTAVHNYDVYPDIEARIGAGTQRRILYAKSLPIAETTNISGNVFVYLDEAYLLRQFRDIQYQDSGFIYIMDKDGEYIVYKNSSDLEYPSADADHFSMQSGYFRQNIESQRMIVTYYRNDARGWIYVAALPEEQVLAPTASIRLYIKLLILFAILIGSIYVFNAVTRLSKPITNVYKILMDNDSDLFEDGFEYAISKLIENNQEMQEALKNKIPEVRTSIFYNLLINRFRSDDEIMENYRRMNIELNAKYYVILIAAINDLDSNTNLEEISAQKTYLNSILTQHFSNIQGIYDLDFEKTTLLLSYNEACEIDSINLAEKSAKELVDQLLDSIKMSISFSGDITNNILRVPTCFFNAHTAMSYSQKNPIYTIQWFNRDQKTAAYNLYYPIELESQLISLVNSGNTIALFSVFNKIDYHNKSIIETGNSPAFFKLLNAMYASLIRVFSEMPKQNEKASLLAEKIESQLEIREDLTRTYFLLKEFLMYISEMNKAELRKKSSLQSQIQQYINEQYTNPQLSLYSVSNVFGITEVYLSQLFKSISGENFSKYIEKLRMERAHQLIEQGCFLIHEIAQMVGYYSPQVFRRAYKRYYGITPTGTKTRKG